MVTTRLYSPFLVVTAIVVFYSCSHEKARSNNSSAVAVFNEQLAQAKKTDLTSTFRLKSASEAYSSAIKTDSAFLVWQAFSVKYPLLQQLFPKESESFLFDYKKQAAIRHDTLNLANASFETGKSFFAKSQNDSAYYYYNASRILCEARKDSLGTAEKLVYMADLHYRYNDFVEMENTTTAALQFIRVPPKTVMDSTYLSIFYNNYGLAYNRMYEYERALIYFRKSKALNKDALYQATTDNNIALVQMQKGDYAKAIAILRALLLSKTVLQNRVLQARVLDNLGSCLAHVNDSGALKLLQQSLAIRETQNDVFEAVASHVSLAKYYAASNPALAKKNAQQAYQKATQLNSTDDRLTALKLLSHDTGPDGRTNAGLYIRIKDSIEEVRQRAKNQFAKIKYDSRIANEENLKLRADTAEKALQIEKGKRESLRLYFSLFIILFGFAAFVNWLNKRYKKGKRKEAYQTEIRISKKVHDELANDVYNVMTFAETQDLSNHERKESLMRSLDSVYTRTRDISRENSPVETGAEFPQQLREMLTEYSGKHNTVLISGFDSVPWDLVSHDKKILVHRILQELMVNMKKHSNAKMVALQFGGSNAILDINYTDNGVGMDMATRFSKNGLRNVENRIMAIGGKFIFDSEPQKGVKITITIPIKK